MKQKLLAKGRHKNIRTKVKGERQKVKGERRRQNSGAGLKEKGKARKHSSEVRRRRREGGKDGILDPQSLRTTEIRRAEITVLQY